MQTVGLIGWRGMVGSVLMDRMRNENDFAKIQPSFFSTSNAGGEAPVEAAGAKLKDAHDLQSLAEHDILISCQGGDYTKTVYQPLREKGWKGYWIDAASTLRMEDEAVIILDPVNRAVIDSAIEAGVKCFVGGNCTVSLMLMALGGLFREGLVEWVHASTYQAASGAGAQQMIELMKQMTVLGKITDDALSDPSTTALTLERRVTAAQNNTSFPTESLGGVLAGGLIPWIDRAVDHGQTREEWKGEVELNKILGTNERIPVDGTCVRVGALRCHSQSLLVKLTKSLSATDAEALLRSGNDWVRVVPNEKEATVKALNPAAVSGKLDVAIGRVHPMRIGEDYLGAFTIGDQLLWGAAEPLRRMLRLLVD